MKGNILIIGASGDIGSAIAIKLGNEGYQLLLHYHKNVDNINHIRSQLKSDSILSEIQADLSDNNGIKRLISAVVFKVDHIVFAGGHAYYGLLQETSEKVMDEMLTIHVKAPMLITKHLLPSMIHQKFGNIVVLSSIWGEAGASMEVVYSTVKGAQNSFVKSLAKEVAPSGISVNAVSPGFIETKMNDHLLHNEKEAIISDIPMNRAGSVSEVAHTVHFLLDEKSNYIQGEVIHVTGGW